MRQAGWERCLDVPALFYCDDHRAGGIIDDLLIRTRGGREPAMRLVDSLNAGVKALGGKPLAVTIDVKTWGGMLLTRSPCRRVITTSMPHYVEGVAAVWLPGYLATGCLPAGVPTGKALRVALSALRPADGDGPITKAQREVMSIGQVLRWCSLRIARVLRPAHLVARVQHRAPPEAMACALGVLALACDQRQEGRSYGLAAERSQCDGVLKGTLHDGKRATVHVADGEAKLSAGAPNTEGDGGLLGRQLGHRRERRPRGRRAGLRAAPWR